VAAQLAAAAMILDRLPDAMHAVGGGTYGARAPHPAAVQPARGTRSRRAILVVVLALVLLLPTVILGLVGAAIYLFSGPDTPASAATTTIDLLRPGAPTAVEAQVGQRLGFRLAVDLEARQGASKASRRRASNNVHATRLQVTVTDPTGQPRVLACPVAGGGGMLSTSARLRFTNLKLGCAFVAAQTGTHRVLATPTWREVSPERAALSVVVGDRP
jgi:hypothetical protein